MADGTRGWNRKLWGVEFSSGNRRERPMLLGALWDDNERRVTNRRTSEPTRTLLFFRRIDARAWCNARNAEWQAHNDPIVKAWHVRPVRVRETLQVIP